MPLSIAETGKTVTVIRVGGNGETRLFLENLGFVAGTKVAVVASSEGSLIVNVRDARIAVGKEMAMKIMVS